MKLRFDEIERSVPTSAGLYEIFTDHGIALKVGIAANLRIRLLQHARSSQQGLKIIRETNSPIPRDITSKKSILAKHLYFDTTITDSYDLKSEQGRRHFLLNCCHLVVQPTNTREEARIIEIALERSGAYRYVGRVSPR
jgi:hypothetical protein